MKIYLDCYPCFLRQALHASRLAGGDDRSRQFVLNETLKLLGDLPPGVSPPEIARLVHRLVRETISAVDPYAEAKAESTRTALELYPKLKELLDESGDRLGAALRLSIAGNIIDLGVFDFQYDLWETVERVMKEPFAIDDETALRQALERADHVLYLADNAGETVFDRLLIEELEKPVIYAVKGGPILNDATLEDARAAGLDKLARVVENGSDAHGTILSLCSEEFRAIYDAAPLVIAKGQANYETLSEEGPRVFCLLQIKCQVVAGDIGAPMGGIVIRRGKG